MNKRAFVILAVCLLLVSALGAHADIIWEPEVVVEPDIVVDNDFYLQNWGDCKFLEEHEQQFRANGGGGFVSVKKAPYSEGEIAVIKNNEICTILCTIEGKREGKAETWGLAQDHEGWVPMDQLLPPGK